MAVRCRGVRPARFLSRTHSGQVAADESRPTFFLQGALVNKTELIEHIAKNADISKAAATRALESTIGAIRTRSRRATPCRSSVSALSQWASVLHAPVAIRAPGTRLKSRPPRFRSSVRAKR